MFSAIFITPPPACCALSMNTSQLSPGDGSFSSSYPSFQMSGITGTQDCQKKQTTSFGLHLPWDFPPFLCNNLDAPKYPHRHPGVSPEIPSVVCPANSEYASLGPLSDQYFSLSFFSSILMWMPPAIAQGKGDIVKDLLHSREQFLTDCKPSLPITQWAVEKATIPCNHQTF